MEIIKHEITDEQIKEATKLLNRPCFSKLDRFLVLLTYIILPSLSLIYIIITKMDFIDSSIYLLALSYTIIFSTFFSYLGTKDDGTATLFFAEIFYSSIIFVYPITYFIGHALLASIMSFIPLVIGLIYLIIKMPKYTQIAGIEDEIAEVNAEMEEELRKKNENQNTEE